LLGWEDFDGTEKKSSVQKKREVVSDTGEALEDILRRMGRVRTW
jgi:hypothetical protein